MRTARITDRIEPEHPVWVLLLLLPFNPAEIEKWIDEDEQGMGQTALCPRCGIDSIMGEGSGYTLSPEFLKLMEYHGFRI